MKKTMDKGINILAKNKNGITMVALIITIVVMLILAAVTIGVINGGLFGYARQSKIKTEIGEIKEQFEQTKVMSKIKIKDGTINDILKINSPYNDSIIIEDGKLVYVSSKWTEKERATLEEMGINASTRQ